MTVPSSTRVHVVVSATTPPAKTAEDTTPVMAGKDTGTAASPVFKYGRRHLRKATSTSTDKQSFVTSTDSNSLAGSSLPVSVRTVTLTVTVPPSAGGAASAQQPFLQTPAQQPFLQTRPETSPAKLYHQQQAIKLSFVSRTDSNSSGTQSGIQKSEQSN